MTHPDTATLTAAASLARHAPESLRAAHLAPKLEALAERLRKEAKLEERGGEDADTRS